ncbi:helix-turn-helix domain-containing protein [Amycolatopsis sp. cg5]|uniref:helix-turn-helix domain-containing protein n=1 Tax=Amycolatopsis sp. cg5 TaxID=3238802 RepID=UPI0035254AF8
MPESFGTYLARTREERGLSLRQVAASCGVAATTIARIENGEYHLPNPELLLNLVDTLGLSLTAAVELLEPYRALCTRFANERTTP